MPEESNLKPQNGNPQIAEEVSTGPLYRSNKGKIAPLPGSSKKARLSADPRSEYVAGGPYYLAATYLRSLAWAVDDVTDDFGDDLYDRMLLDSQVASDVETLILSVLSDGVTLLPAIEQFTTDPTTGEQSEHPQWQQAQQICDFCRRNLADLSDGFNPETASPLYWSIHDLLRGMALGNRIAEKIFSIPQTGEDAGKLCLKALKVKPRNAAAFVVDPFKNVVGILALVPGNAMPVLVQSLLGDPDKIPNLLPRRKFAIFSMNPKDSDPRGTSVLRPAYDPWFIKQQLKQLRIKYFAQLAGGSVVGFTAPDAQQVQSVNPDGSPQIDQNGNPVIVNPEAAMLSALIQWQSGTAAAFPAGASVDVHFPPDSNPFDPALDRQDREISYAILGNTRTTNEAQHGSRADSETGQDVTGLRVQHGKRALAILIASDLLTDLVEFNFGPDALSLLPRVLTSKVEQQDLAEVGMAVAQLQRGGYFSPSQYPQVDAKLGLPVRTQEEAAAMGAMQQAQIDAATGAASGERAA